MAYLHGRIATANDNEIDLTITTESRFGYTFLFLIPCLRHLAAQQGKTLNVKVTTKIYERLIDMAFIEPAFKINLGVNMRLERLEDNEQTRSLAIRVVNDMPVAMSPTLREDMVSRVGEVLNNARKHANARHILVGSYPKRQSRKYSFICYDTGTGIPNNVRKFLNENRAIISDEQAVRWALDEFNTTVTQATTPRGHTLYTYDGRVEPPTDKFQRLAHSFHGTLFEMDVNPDARPYRYRGE